MRRYHRWLSVLAGLFILWIATTGSIVQFSRMTAPAEQRPAAAAPGQSVTADPDRDSDASADTDRDSDGPAAATPAATSPAAATPPAEARPKRSPQQEFIHFVTELHSGEEFGFAGQLISLVSGLALVFFAISGLWMYIQMFRGRLAKVDSGGKVRGGKWFWS